MHLFHLDWPVDRLGYRIEEPPRPKKFTRSVAYPPFQVEAAGAQILTGDTGPSIVRNRGTLDLKQPLKVPGLCRHLAACPKTAEGVLQFVQRFGFLQKAKARSERVDKIFGLIDIARAVVDLAEAHAWEALRNWFASRSDRELFAPRGGFELDLSIMDGSPRPMLRLRPVNLFNAAIVQMLDEVSRGAQMRHCARPGCPEWFEYGPDTGRRDTARYCSTRCKDAHTYMKRKGVAK